MTMSGHMGQDEDLVRIRAELAEVSLPATQDDLLAYLVRHHVPVRLVSRLAGLPRTKQYWSVEAVCRDAAGFQPSMPTDSAAPTRARMEHAVTSRREEPGDS